MPDAVVPPQTGHERVDAALAGLGEMESLSPADQLAALSAAHEALHRALALEQGR